MRLNEGFCFSGFSSLTKALFNWSQVNSNMSVLFHTTSGKITAQAGMSVIAVCNLFDVLPHLFGPLLHTEHILYLFAKFLSEITACCSCPFQT